MDASPVPRMNIFLAVAAALAKSSLVGPSRRWVPSTGTLWLCLPCRGRARKDLLRTILGWLSVYKLDQLLF